MGAAVSMVAVSMVATAGAASAAPVYQITGQWAPKTPTTVAKGDVVTGVWRVNVNDDAKAPANDPVPNVNFSVTLQHGVFTALPDACLTANVTPASGISTDGKTLVCNLGTQKEGTATVVQAPLVADGATGDKISATGTIAGQHADLPPIAIDNPFGMDMAWETPNSTIQRSDSGTDVPLQWTLWLNSGSEAGPSTVTYDLDVAAKSGASVSVAPDACSAFTGTWDQGADGHPWSGGTVPNQEAPFVKTCTLTQTDANTFTLTLTGIDYSPTLVPTQDSQGNPLPTNKIAIASGEVWFRVNGTQNDSISLKSSAPTYTSVGGATSTDDPSNNASGKTWTGGGSWNVFPGAQGSWWSGQYQVAPGDHVDAATGGPQFNSSMPSTDTIGQCVILDTKYVTFDGGVVFNYSWAGTKPNQVSSVPGATLEYYVGSDPSVDPTSGSYDPNSFTCGDDSAGWTTTEPKDLSTVKAVRETAPISVYERDPNGVWPLYVGSTVKSSAPIGQDVWEWGELAHNGAWVNNPQDLVATPGKRYPFLGSGRDMFTVVGLTPSVSKSVDRSVLQPGQAATYTLTYAANGTGHVQPTVDGYKLVDTLPVGMSYVTGSATPAHVVSTNGSGAQVLTWTLDGVTTNAEHVLTYQATAASTVTPGQTLTNSATASVQGQTTQPAAAQVTVSTNGFTTIAKTADEPFIPNLDGKGDGSGSWTVSLRSSDPLPQAYTDTIDVLPYVGDGRGTHFHGSYALSGPVTAVAGATVYYTTTAPTKLSDDPADPSNGSADSITGNTVGWSTTFTADATAVRVIGPELAPGAEQQFQVPITTKGAEGGDVLVNVAQARDGHTELVMRTSAPITVANYYSASLKKYVQDDNGVWHDANSPADYPTFRYGDTIHYRIVVTNTGQGTLHNVKVSDDKQPALGDFTVASLAPGQSETHEYSIVLTKETSGTVVNTASATADTPPDSKVPPTIPPDPAGFDVANYTTVKTADPASGTPVSPGQVIHYTVTVTQQGSAPAAAVFSDDLSKVLANASYNGDVKASIGSAKITGDTLAWTGTVPVGGTATVTYSVTVHSAADLAKASQDLLNPVTSPGCAVVDGKTPNCVTDNKVGWFTYDKTVDPASGTAVAPGQKLTYTIGIVQHGTAALKGASVTDDLSDVLDDAAYGGDVAASSGTASVKSSTLTWSGDLAVGQKVTVTYSVTVDAPAKLADSNDVLANPVTTTDKRGSCETSVGCQVSNPVGWFTFDKTADPASGTAVSVGDTVTYTVRIVQHGKAALTAASVVDDMTDVVDNATYRGDAKATSGTVSYAAPRLTWNGDLAVGQTVTITYTATVTRVGDGHIANTVTTTDHRGSCDTAVGCATRHPITTPATTTPTTPTTPTATSPAPPTVAPPSPPTSGLAYTGVDVTWPLGTGLALLFAGGLLLAGLRLRRRQQRAH